MKVLNITCYAVFFFTTDLYMLLVGRLIKPLRKLKFSAKPASPQIRPNKLPCCIFLNKLIRIFQGLSGLKLFLIALIYISIHERKSHS